MGQGFELVQHFIGEIQCLVVESVIIHMSDLREYLTHLTSTDYKVSIFSKEQETVRTFSEVSNRHQSQKPSQSGMEDERESLESSGFSFSGTDRERGRWKERERDTQVEMEGDGERDNDIGSESHWQSINKKYLSYDPKVFISKAQQLMKTGGTNISLHSLTQLMNQALQILNVLQTQNKPNKHNGAKQDVFPSKLMMFLDWVQERIEIEKSRSTERRRSKENIDTRILKKREFFDKSGKVTIEIRKVGLSETNRTVRNR